MNILRKIMRRNINYEERIFHMRILLAEDDRHLNDTLTYQLETEQFTVDCCFYV